MNTSTGGAGFTSYDLSQLGIKNDATFSVDFGNGDPLFSGGNPGIGRSEPRDARILVPGGAHLSTLGQCSKTILDVTP